MAIKSIFKSIEINDDKKAQAFLDAIESSRRAQENIKEPEVSAKCMSKEEIAKIFGKADK